MANLTHASWNTVYSAALIGLFPARSVLGSYLNLTIASCVLALVLIAVTRGRLGYRQDDRQDPRRDIAVSEVRKVQGGQPLAPFPVLARIGCPRCASSGY